MPYEVLRFASIAAYSGTPLLDGVPSGPGSVNGFNYRRKYVTVLAATRSRFETT
jgi:hypothetical protein